ncbi:hypothetical protein DPMN_043951 [Dreissena polymorpha]|uniref:Uncharacterized protein n=1 Tax=Dreissena polymorpha TaxID=45954 RepID=A0A9D4D1I9_DREPO|nr:hypothetical protein DPMN_043951 [Dreissena polymorpha]
MFVHKTIHEFLASLFIAMNQTDIEDILNAIQSVYCDSKSLLDIGQLFIFTCGMCAQAANRMSMHIMDVITCDIERMLHSSSDPEAVLVRSINAAQNIILDGFIEGAANEQSCLQLTIRHIVFDIFYQKNEKYKDALNTLIDMNISNIISIYAQFLQYLISIHIAYRILFHNQEKHCRICGFQTWVKYTYRV